VTAQRDNFPVGAVVKVSRWEIKPDDGRRWRVASRAGVNGRACLIGPDGADGPPVWGIARTGATEALLWTEGVASFYVEAVVAEAQTKTTTEQGELL
jgi:hypothetical protein